MSEAIEQHDVVIPKDIIESDSEHVEKQIDTCDNLQIVENITIKRGRGRPKKEPQPESEQQPTKTPKRTRKPRHDEPVVKRPKGRPKVENPCKPGCPKAGRDYFKAYYKSHNAGIIINCPSCNTLTEKFNIKNHMRSKMCAKYSQFNKCQIIENSEN